MDEFHEESNKAHNAESNCRGDGNLLELFAVGLGAALDQAQRVLGEGTARFTELHNLIHFQFFSWNKIFRSKSTALGKLCADG